MRKCKIEENKGSGWKELIWEKTWQNKSIRKCKIEKNKYCQISEKSDKDAKNGKNRYSRELPFSMLDYL